jgi:hypothetical protein
MKTIAFAAVGLTALALSACASRGYDGYYDGYYDRYGANHGYHDRYYGYSDRDRYYGDRDRTYGDRDRYGYDRDRNNDGVPNYADRRPEDPYRN